MTSLALDNRKASPLALLFSMTLFLSAGLMFTVQPMIGKMLLFLFGGAPNVWLAAMAYFQAALLGGYFLAYLLSRFAPRLQVLAVLLLLLAGLAVQPLQIDESALGDRQDAWAVVSLLAVWLSLPFIAISALSPSLQRLFAQRSSHPYFLFAASNLGSFAGLLAYPFVIERSIGLSAQAGYWQWLYAGLIVLCAVCLLVVKGRTEAAAETAPPVLWRQRGLWVLLAFVPSSLMMGVTAQVTADIGGVPLFWVLPLALYLLTLVRSFAEKNNLATIRKLFPFYILMVLLILMRPSDKWIYLSFFGLFILLLVFTVGAWTFHAALANEKPPAERLTEYYLWLALGGALGGSFNAFLVPWLFPSGGEFMTVSFMGIILILFLYGGKGKTLYDPWSMIYTASALVFLYILLRILFLPDIENAGIFVVFLKIALACSIALFSVRPSVLGMLLLGAGIFSVSLQGAAERAVHRNFFGMMRVVDYSYGDQVVRKLVHGTTVHGLEQIAPEKKTEPNGYYRLLADVLSLSGMRKIGMIGLGTGTALCYTAPGRQFTVYEIDPDVVEVADRWFDFMRTCGKPQIVIGDGRRKLQAEASVSYDAFIVDAFSSDAIPVHLLTEEALKLYFARLRPGGVLALHISNRFYDLVPQIAALAKADGLAGVVQTDAEDRSKLLTASAWVALASSQATLRPLIAEGWKPLPASEERPWTDDYSNALSALKRAFTE